MIVTLRSYVDFYTFSRETILLKFDTNNYNSELSYVPGDHMGIYAANKRSVVDRILGYLQNAPPSDQMVLMEIIKERTTPLGTFSSLYNYYLHVYMLLHFVLIPLG